VALGNLCIGVELLVKALVGSGNLSLIFVNLPVELKTHFVSAGDTKPSVDTKPHEVEFHAGRYKTIEFEPALKLFYAFRPHLKPELDPHTKFLLRYRNKGLHSIIRESEQFAVDRIAFIALKLLDNLRKCTKLGLGRWEPTEEDMEFLRQYESHRVDRVKKSMDEAQKRAKTAPRREISVEALDYWHELPTSCPVCGQQAILDGYTSLEGTEVPTPEEPFLVFVAGAINCSTCGLSLDGIKELELAGVKTIHNRRDDCPRWCREQGPDY